MSSGKNHRVVLRLAVVAAFMLLATNAGVLPAMRTSSSTAHATTPTSGALFGMWPGLNPAGPGTPGGDLGPTSYLPGLISWQGRNNGVLQAFGNINDVTNAFGSYFPAIWDTWGSVPMYGIVNNQYRNDQIYKGKDASGNDLPGENDNGIIRFGQELDKFIHDTATGAPSGGRRVYLRLHIEPNSVVYPTYSPLYQVIMNPDTSPATTPCDELLTQEELFVNAWRHIHTLVMSQGNFHGQGDFTPDQVQWMFNVTQADGTALPDDEIDAIGTLTADQKARWKATKGCANGASNIMEKIYPGDDYVDWVSIDGFQFVDRTPPEPKNRDLAPSQVFTPMRDRLRAKAPGKPLAIAEAGASTIARNNVNVKYRADKGDWLAAFFSYVQSSDIRMVVWDNLNRSPTDWSVYAPDAPDSNTCVPPPLTEPAPYPRNPAELCFVDYTMSRGTAKHTHNGVVYNVYTEWKNGINLPYFVEPTPGDPRFISDAVFRGTW